MIPALALCHYVLHWLPSGLHIPPAESWVRPCCPTPPCYQPWASAAKVPGHPRHSSPCFSLISRIFPHFQDLPSNAFLSDITSWQGPFFFWGPVPLSRTPSPQFSQPKWSMGGSLVCGQPPTGGSVSWLFINWSIQVVLLFFSSRIIKICKQTIPVTASK